LPHPCPARLIAPLSKASFKYADTEVLDGLAEEFRLSRNTIRNYLQSIEVMGHPVRRPYSVKTKKTISPEIPPPETAAEREEYFDFAWKEYQDLIGMSRSHKPPKAIKSKVGLRRRLAVISDTHGRPFSKGISKMLSEKPDLVIAADDIHDLMAVSKFPKDIDIPIEEDVANVRAMVETIAGQCHIKLCRGNHDDRLSKYMMSRIDARYMKLVNTDMLGWAVMNVPNAEVVNNLHGFTTSQGSVFPDVLQTSFLIFEGDAVFGHAEMARKGELNTVRGVYEWYENWRRAMDWPEAAFFGQAHVHRAGLAYPSGGHRIIAELGAMLTPGVLQYAMAGNPAYTPPTIGYTILEQHKERGNWKTDLNSCQFVLC